MLWIGIRESGAGCPLASPTSTPITEVHAGVSLMIFFFSFSFIFHHLFFSILLYGLWMMRANHKELTCVFQKHSGKHMAKNTTSIRRTKRIGT